MEQAKDVKVIKFSRDFYKKVYKEAFDYCADNFENEDNEQTGECTVSISVDGYDLEFTADVECMYEDESFNHAFGTWHDPYAGYYFADVYGIRDVTVYDDDGDCVDGFSIDEYNEQFFDDEHLNIRKGTKCVSSTVTTMVCVRCFTITIGHPCLG